MLTGHLHGWDLSPWQAIALQVELAGRVVLADDVRQPLRTIAGGDVSYRLRSNRLHAAVTLLDAGTMEVIDTATASATVDFPYIPGLLSFRELPVLLQAFARLAQRPDVVLVDGQGIAHPRRFGLASHLGLWLDLPTIGCAKSLLCGAAETPGERRGDWSMLCCDGKEVGRLLRTRDRVRPLIVSPGHLVDCARAVEIVLQCGRGYRLPEPTRQAHLLSNRLRQACEVMRPSP